MEEKIYIVSGSDKRFCHLGRLFKESGRDVYYINDNPFSDNTAKLTRPGADEKTVLFLPFSLSYEEFIYYIKMIGDSSWVYCGKIPGPAGSIISEKHLVCHNILEDEIYTRRNAIPTAEGALAIALSSTPRVISGSEVLVVGYGRVGRACAALFRKNDANVSVAARRKEVRADAENDRMETISIPLDHGIAARFDIILNTVPQKNIIGREFVSCIKKDAVIIELASGRDNVFDDGSARLIKAPSLPGKYAPETAAGYIFKAYTERND